jgi:polysaccharide biosynthesis/export protein
MTRLARILIMVGALVGLASEAWSQGFASPYSERGAKTGAKQQKESDAFAPMAETEAKTLVPPAPDSLAVNSLATDSYRLGPQDVLEISVFGAPELSGTLIVGDNGNIQIPLLGETPAAGKTVQELQRDLAAKLGAKYLQSPQVTVIVKEYNSRTVILTGEIGKPGVYPLKGETTLLQLVASAGGFKEGSDSTVLVLRKSGAKRAAAKFDVSAIEKGRADDPIMHPGDTIVAGSSVIKKTYKTFLKALPIAGAFMMF